MASLFSFSVKQTNGSYKKYTGSIADKSDNYGNNVVIYEEQSKEQREAKEPKKYFGNGRVFWTDGKILITEKKEGKKDSPDLPF